MSAQLWRALVADEPGIDEQLAAGEFGPLREWLRTHIHAYGRKLDSRELLRRATGEELRVEPFLTYLEGKLLDAGLLTAPVRVPRS
jgi:carboxypeptidase Taq